jgi:cell division protein FtsL
MRTLSLCLLFLVLCSAVMVAQSNKSTESQAISEKRSVDAEKTIPWQDYKDALKDERELLEKQAEKHFAALEKLYDTALKIFGGILAAALLIGGFFFGKTLVEVKNFAREQTAAIVRSQLEAEIRKELTAALKSSLGLFRR